MIIITLIIMVLIIIIIIIIIIITHTHRGRIGEIPITPFCEARFSPLRLGELSPGGEPDDCRKQIRTGVFG